MANKFFGLFDINKDGLQKQFDELNQKLKKALNVDVDLEGIEDKGNKIIQLGVRMRTVADQIVATSTAIREAMDMHDEGEVNRLKRQREALVEDQKANDLEYENLRRKSELQEKESKSFGERNKLSSLTQKSTETYHTSLKALNNSFIEGELTIGQMQDALEELKASNNVSSIKDGLQKQFDELNQKLKKALNVDVDLEGIEDKGNKIIQLGVRMRTIADQIVTTSTAIREAMDMNDEGEVNRLKRQREALVEDQKANDLEYENLRRKSELQEKESKSFGERNKLSSLTQKSTETYHTSLKALNNSFIEGELTIGQMQDALEELKASNNVSSIIESSDSITDIQNLGDKLAPVLGEAIGGPLGMFVAEAFKKAWNQIIDVNDILVDLERNTGGVIQATDQGSDVFGNSQIAFRSLTSELAASNLSVGEYKNALVDLSKEGFGQTIGVMQDLNGSSKELKQFGIEAARLGKLYGANIGPSVRNLIQNFGSSIEGATQTMREGAETAKSLGLNVDFYMKNFEQVTNLIGDIYFRSEENMKSLALFASQLGTSVNVLAKGFIPMKGMNDLFEKQQETLAFGLERTAATMAQVYALNATGQSDKAIKIQAAALALDLQAMDGVDREGRINKVGLDTLQQVGISKEQIESINKLSMQAERTGIDIMKLGTGALTAADQLTIAKDENKNLKLTEQFSNIGTLAWSTIVDPIVNLVGPMLKLFGNLLEGVVKIVGGIISFLNPIFEGIGEVFSFLSEGYIILKSFFQNLWESVEKVTDGFGGVIKVLRVLGNVIGVVVAQVPAPVFFARLAEKFDFLGLKTTEATEAEERKRLELEKHGEGGSLNANLTNEEYKRISPSEQWEQNKKAYEQTVKGIGSTIQEDKAATVKAMEKHIEKTFTEKSSDSKPVANLKLNVHTDGMYANQSQLSQTLLFN